MLSRKRKLQKDLVNDEVRAVSMPKNNEDESLTCKVSCDIAPELDTANDQDDKSGAA